MVAQKIQINETVLKRFVTLQKNNRLAHAYLFIGPRQVGKTQTALAASKFLNCENIENNVSLRGGTFLSDDEAIHSKKIASPKKQARNDTLDDFFCDICPSCLKINHGNHPDIHLISCEETETIKIEQVRELINQIQLKSFEARVKVFILQDVEKLTLQGANALLKTLEEPAKDSLLILTSCVPEEVVDTIRSRCHAMNFSATSPRALAGQLAQDFALNPSAAKSWAS